MKDEKRRSERIMFTIPVAIRGADPDGNRFEAGGRTITVNRHGARIQVSRPLPTGRTVHIANENTFEQADFRVVGPVSPPTERVGEWGVECLEGKKNIWGIYFPPPAPEAEARGLLECRKCHGITLTPLSLVDVEVLDTAGIVSKPCAACGTATSQGYPEEKFKKDFPAHPARASQGELPAADRRRSPRAAIQVPARIRDYYGGTEHAQTENLSKEGFSFTSEKKYHVGQGVMILCPDSPTGEKMESRARIVREEPLAGTSRCLYAVRYEMPAP